MKLIVTMQQKDLYRGISNVKRHSHNARNLENHMHVYNDTSYRVCIPDLKVEASKHFTGEKTML